MRRAMMGWVAEAADFACLARRDVQPSTIFSITESATPSSMPRIPMATIREAPMKGIRNIHRGRKRQGRGVTNYLGFRCQICASNTA
jgi:hypothetical protein